MSFAYDPRASKKPINLSINSELLKAAKALDINLSASFEQALEGVVQERLADAWLAENREAMNCYNQHVEVRGTFSDGIRSF